MIARRVFKRLLFSTRSRSAIRLQSSLEDSQGIQSIVKLKGIVNKIKHTEMQWLVTGCSSGLGLALVEAILAIPDQKVIATSRNPSTSPEAVQRIASHPNGAWETLDASSATIEADLRAITSKHGSIDVLINNAGYAMGGATESLPIERVKEQYETNFFGPLRLMQSVLPAMREKGNGTIVNISSAEAFLAHPGAGLYASTKWALEGISEALAWEVSVFGVRVLLVEPGAMRTSFFDSKNLTNLVPIPEAYQGTMVDYVIQALMQQQGAERLDPVRSAREIVKEVLEPTEVRDGDGKVSGKLMRLPLGTQCIGVLEDKVKSMDREASLVKARALACDFE